MRKIYTLIDNTGKEVENHMVFQKKGEEKYATVPISEFESHNKKNEGDYGKLSTNPMKCKPLLIIGNKLQIMKGEIWIEREQWDSL